MAKPLREETAPSLHRTPAPPDRDLAARRAAAEFRAKVEAAVAEAARDLEQIEDLATRELAAAYAVEGSRFRAMTAAARVRSWALLLLHDSLNSWAKVAEVVGVSREMCSATARAARLEREQGRRPAA